MFKKIFGLIGIGFLLVSLCGCELIGVAIGAGISYGIYQATQQ